ncbi:MAG: glucose/galactose MFS transporter [Sphingomonas sp.]|nr:glucose/galactose MFS transporter [Sphingomonas sp.]
MVSVAGQGPQAGGGAGKQSFGLLVIVVAVFFLFGGITNLNDVLIPKLKGLFDLNYAQSMLVQFAFFTSYAIFSIPAGMLMKKLGYFRGIVLGFAIMAAGCLLFLPAAYSSIYWGFLAALFMVGGGITLLQVAVNPLIISLGPPQSAHSRLTFAQFFNSVGVFLMVRFGAELILGEEAAPMPEGLSGASLRAYQAQETSVIAHTYIGLAIVLVLIAAFFWWKRGLLGDQKVEETKVEGTFALLKRPRLAFGVLGIFVYVGAEVAIASLMINYLEDTRTLGLDPRSAGVMLSYYWLGALIGRMLGGFLLRIIKPGLLLAIFGCINIVLLAISANTSGEMAGYSIVAIGLFNSIMFPTIFSLATEGLNEQAPQASGLLCTAIVGGALVPLATGAMADAAGLAMALVIPAICYGVIAAFGIYGWRNKVAPEEPFIPEERPVFE